MSPQREVDGLTLTLRSDPGFPLKLDSLDRRSIGVELLSAGEDDGVVVATIFVPDHSLEKFLTLLDDYAAKDTKKGTPRNQKLIESIASARLAVTRDLWRDNGPFPEPNQAIHWEVWLRSADRDTQEVHGQFVTDCAAANLRPKHAYVVFPDRVVGLAFGTAEQISRSIGLLTSIAELREAKELATEYLRIPARFQAELVDDLLDRTSFSGPDAPAVLLLDTGVNRGHPLIQPALDALDMHAVEASWGTADHDTGQHGTGMAGIALYGDLTSLLAGSAPVSLNHRLESAKLLPAPPAANEPEVYGYVTEQAVARAIIAAPQRHRAICLAITTDDRDAGLPSAWSGAIDQMCAGVGDGIPKLMFVSAGNINDIRDGNRAYVYHRTNCEEAGVEDPGQAWNVVTVGAFTEKVVIHDTTFTGWQPIGESQDLCPTSRTSLAWGEEAFAGWPIKPDVVMEGGNYATDGTHRDGIEDLCLLSTFLGGDGRLFQAVSDTSPATADAARLAAGLWSEYSQLWPETIRGLIVHSAQWTDAMYARFPGATKAAAHQRLRCYGYGVPDSDRARYSAENAITLIFEGELQPYRREGSSARTNVMHLHQLPWPTAILQGLGSTPVSMRATLSYFIEPSPGRRGWLASRSHRYQSHGLRFDVIRPEEDEHAFLRRLTRAEWDDADSRPDNVDETRNWRVGSYGRRNGSLHSDWWNGTAAELAACDRIAVFPVNGWWKERPHKQRVESGARYALIVSIETPAEGIDLYAAVSTQVEIETAAE